MPVLILLFLLVDILSVSYIFFACLIIDKYLQYRKIDANEDSNMYLYIFIAVSVFVLFGKFLLRWIVSSKQKKELEPKMFDPVESDKLQRPDGSVVNIEYYGPKDAQPIIFVHGMNANIKTWYYQKLYFEKSHRLIMIDLPGYGKSKMADKKDFSLDKMAADLEAVMEHTEAVNPLLWGHSMGGMTILSLVSKKQFVNQKTVKGIILQHTTYTNPIKTMIFSQYVSGWEKPFVIPCCYFLIMTSPLLWLFQWLSYMNGTAHILIRLLTFTGSQSPKQLEFITFMSTLTSPAITARSVLAMIKYDVTKTLHNINVPTLIIAAEKDRLTKPSASEYMKNQIPGAEMVTVSHGGHESILEQHKDVNKAAERFIQQVYASVK